VELKLKFKPKHSKSFQDLVDERVEVQRELRKLSSPRGAKLSAHAFLRESVQIAKSTPERIDKLRKTMEAGDGVEHANATLRRFISFIRTPNISRPCDKLDKLGFLLRPDTAETMAELTAIQSSTFELFALGVKLAAEKYPDAFGEVESSRGLDERLLQLSLLRDELDKKIAEGFAAADLHYGPRDAQGRALVAFKIGDGKIPVDPVETAGQRLADFMIMNAI
jgi:hypothetical protein